MRIFQNEFRQPHARMHHENFSAIAFFDEFWKSSGVIGVRVGHENGAHFFWVKSKRVQIFISTHLFSLEHSAVNKDLVFLSV